jgi:hypothetical protein
MNLTLKALVIGLLAASAAQCQIAQNHPELCGNEIQATPVPPGVTAITHQSNGAATLTIETDRGTRRIDLPGVQSEIQQVCPIARDRLVVFGSYYDASYFVYIIDRKEAILVDSFVTFPQLCLRITAGWRCASFIRRTPRCR